MFGAATGSVSLSEAPGAITISALFAFPCSSLILALDAAGLFPCFYLLFFGEPCNYCAASMDELSTWSFHFPLGWKGVRRQRIPSDGATCLPGLFYICTRVDPRWSSSPFIETGRMFVCRRLRCSRETTLCLT